MSTKTSIKRIALVAVSALGFGLLSVVPAKAAAQSLTATVSPVRVTLTDGVRDLTPYSKITWTSGSGNTLAANDTLVVTLTQAPTAGAVVELVVGSSIGAISDNTFDGTAAGSDSLAATGTAYTVVAADFSSLVFSMGINASVAGRYVGTISYWRLMGGSPDENDTISFDFTTRGAGASLSVALTDATVPSAATAVGTSATVTLKDSAGNTTQPLFGDTVLLTSSSATEIPTPGTSGTSTAIANFYDGVEALTVTPKNSATAGSYTITATPRGTMPGAGVAAATATLTVNAAATVGPASLSVSSPTTDIKVTATTATDATTSMNLARITGAVTVTGSGATAGASVPVDIAVEVAGTTPTITANGTTVNENAAATITKDATIYVTAGSDGSVTVNLDITGATFAASDYIILTSGTPIASGGATYAKQTLTWVAATNIVTSTPAAGSLNVAKTGDALTVTGAAKDFFGNALSNYIVTASQSGTPTGGTTSQTGTSVSARTASDGSYSLSVPAPSATFVGSSTLTITVTSPSGGSVSGSDDATTTTVTEANPTTFTVEYSSTGLAATLTLTDNDTVATGVTQTDLLSTRAIPLVPANLYAAGGSPTASNVVAITVATTTPANLTFSATATGGIRLFTSNPAGAALAAGSSTASGTAGTTTIYAVPTLVGSGNVTVTSGGLSKTLVLTGALDSTAKAQLVTLTKGTNANGNVTYTVKTTDVFGNVVAADVNVSVSGVGYLSNGFKNLTVTTLATNGSNSFDITSDGTGPTGVTATIASGSYTAVSSTQATAQGISASDQDATDSVTIVQAVVPAKSAEVLASEAAEAEAAKATAKAAEALTAANTAGDKADDAKDAADAATAKAADALAEAKLATAAATKAGTDAVAAADAAKAEAKLATAAAKANGEELAKVIKSLADLLALVTKNDADLKAAAEAAVDAALEAIDAANAATDAANTGAEASDASIVAAEEARDAADAATATAEEARDAATEAIDAANAATDAANLALEAAEAATVAAEEARDAADAATAAVEALASEVSTLIAGVTAQIKTLGNVVAKIAKKVKA